MRRFETAVARQAAPSRPPRGTARGALRATPNSEEMCFTTLSPALVPSRSRVQLARVYAGYIYHSSCGPELISVFMFLLPWKTFPSRVSLYVLYLGREGVHKAKMVAIMGRDLVEIWFDRCLHRSAFVCTFLIVEKNRPRNRRTPTHRYSNTNECDVLVLWLQIFTSIFISTDIYIHTSTTYCCCTCM